ncbi:prolactin-releasing peptide [Fukomys damarensis]|uniref:Prolactin-releasing peptide n=1 Tax=Fukomys damarensis TaxID=885580 RepID=A0A091DPQ1_FUKDA|nr:prolactin-releasing peptide [Fukomys damarensis]XP_033619909.1 prolactin-releasing peptide [Fukomys damarensis]KFO32458.1 Prolactin-releasing peptide [Fukomys damarensis]
MAAPRAWLLCLLLLLGLGLRAATSRARPHSMEARTPDISPAWYAGRGIRPVGRFGRSRAALHEVPGPGPRCRLTCHWAPGGPESPGDGSWTRP